jgi:dTDP-4-amino-4,6-dideoxygalactose transaminase
MSQKKYNWPLCASVFTFWDKLKISKFLFTEKIWTYGKWVERYENMWSDYLGGGAYVVMVSSGSAANELIALRRKWELERDGEWPRKNKVVAPVNTWISSVSCWLNSGYEIVFTDVDPRNLNMTSAHLKEVFAKDTKKEIGTVFYTALLGFFGDLEECKRLTEEHGAKFLMDNCEATLSSFQTNEGKIDNVMNFVTCSTSLFYSHFSVSGTEGGLVICRDYNEACWYKMMRSHGLTRGMPDRFKNPAVSPMFDFCLMGSNYRSSNLQAFMASLDFERAIDYSIRERYKIFHSFYAYLDRDRFHNFYQPDHSKYSEVVPLAIPIICKNKTIRDMVELHCRLNGIETRPIIGGVLVAHNAFKNCKSQKFGKPEDYPVANHAHECGLYIGLNKNVTTEMARQLAQDLNSL